MQAMRYRLRTLLILMALGPPILAGAWWTRQRIIEQRRRSEFDRLIELISSSVRPNVWEDVGGTEAIDVVNRGGCTMVAAIDDSPIFDERESIRFEFRDGVVRVFDLRQPAAP